MLWSGSPSAPTLRGKHESVGRVLGLSGESGGNSFSKFTQMVAELTCFSLLAVDQLFSASTCFLHSPSSKPASRGRDPLML